MLDRLIERLKSAAVSDHSQPPADLAIVSLLTEYVQHLKANHSARPMFEDDNVILFEDDHISIWFCRFQPKVKVPPHNHMMTAMIGVYDGIEENALYDADDQGNLTPRQIKHVHAGEVLRIAPDEIHGVTCVSDHPSEAIHVYLGPLTRVDRNLYDVEHGTVLSFTDENYKTLSKTLN